MLLLSSFKNVALKYPDEVRAFIIYLTFFRQWYRRSVSGQLCAN